MPDRPEFPWRPIALGVLLVALTAWGLRVAPRSHLVGSTRVYVGSQLSAHLPRTPTSWDMDLRLDPGIRPPGPAWSLHEGRRPDEGYHLRWLPDRGILQVHRASPNPALLGSVRLTRPPTRISFRRRGGELTVATDERTVLRCLDPMPIPADGGQIQDYYWGCQCTSGGDLGESILTAQLAPLSGPRWGSDGDPGTADDEWLRQRGDHALLRVRAALAAVAVNDPATPGRLGAANAALGVSRTDLATLRGSGRVLDIPGVTEADRSRATSAEDRVRLGQWLALARIHWWLSQDTREHQVLGGNGTDNGTAHLTLAREALDDLMDLGQEATNPEYPGMLLGLLPRLAAQACAIPIRAEDPRQVGERRRRWLELLNSTAEAATLIASSDLGSDDLQLLALMRQACAVLSAPQPVCDPLPLPVDAPPWLTVRWRLLAGDPSTATELPPLPEGSSGLAPAVDLVLGNGTDLARCQATADCLRDLEARRRARSKGLEGQRQAHAFEDSAARIGDDPRLSPRDRAIGLTLVALAIGPSRPALLIAARDRLAPHTALLARRQGGPSEPILAEQDPLAWACLAVLLRRHPDLATNQDDDTGRLLKGLRPPGEYTTLLSGEAAATSWIWLVRLPPAEALAAALAAQEAAIPRESLGALPDWSLLDEVPNLGLPLRLLKPRDDQAPGDLDTP